ncbi:hypothetical protein D1007_01195 [Hordeum vulgare]|nr:hypothetical protein D1007_01195 [Hordeum vulgare]
MPMCTDEVTVLPEEVDAEEGFDGVARVVSVDWNSVELNGPTDLVIAPMDDTEMAKMFGIPVADEDQEEKDCESSMPTDTNATRDRTEDVDGQLMEDAADDVDHAHDDELVNVYDKENPVIAVGKLFPNMDEFRMRKHAGEPLVVEHSWPKKKARGNGCRKKRSSCETVHIQPDLECAVQNEKDLDGVVQNEQDLDVLLQDEQYFDVLMPTEDMGTSEDIPVDVVQAEPILEVELPTEDIPSNVVPTEPILEVVLRAPDDIGSNDIATAVVRNKVVVPGSLVKKIKSMSELGVVQSKTSIAKKKKKLSGRRKQK